MAEDDNFAAPHFQNDDDARRMLESILWPHGPVCPHCGVVDHAHTDKRAVSYRCAEKWCRKEFTVTMRTVMERSKIAPHKWLRAFYLVTSSKRRVSAYQLHGKLNIGYEAAWFMHYRIREAMRDGGLAPVKAVARSPGKVVEADESYFGSRAERSESTRATPFSRRRKAAHNHFVVSHVERGRNRRSFNVAITEAATVASSVRNDMTRNG
jgi:transposase-like protein